MSSAKSLLLLLLPPIPIPLSLLLPGRFQVTGAVGRAFAGAGTATDDALALATLPQLILALAAQCFLGEVIFNGG